MVFKHILNIIAPHTCLVCGHEGTLICKTCISSVVVKKTATCYRCNRISDNGKTCVSCRSSSCLTGVFVASHYEGAIKGLIGALKYSRIRSAAPILAQQVVKCVDASKVDVITSVPVATSRYRTRGYNQAELIAKQAASILAIPYLPLLSRVSNVQQVGNRRADRLKQIHGAFVGRKNVSNLRILVIDDVLTTGATLNECALILRQKGAKTVWGAVAAKH